MITPTRMPTRLFGVDEYCAMADAGILAEGERLELLNGRVLHADSDEPRLFTVDEYYAMAEAGVLSRQERVELIHGEIIPMSPIGDRHAYSVDELNELILTGLSGRARVRCQNPVLLDSRREVQPDIAILKLREDSYLSGHPRPTDVLLLVEVSDSTVEYDRDVKMPMYVAAGIPETWIVNIPSRTIEAYADPRGGDYRTYREFRHGNNASPLAFPDIALPVSGVVPE